MITRDAPPSTDAPAPSFRQRVYRLLENPDRRQPWGRVIEVGISVLILLNVAAVILDTEKQLAARLSALFWRLEVVSVIIFTAEYLVRLWVCPEAPGQGGGLRARLRYVLSPLGLLDLSAILPFYLPVLLPVDLRVLRALRLFRILRLLKLSRYSNAVDTLGRIFYKKRAELSVTCFSIAIILIIASSLVYYAENAAQPEAFSSIPATMWWAIVTLTTVGYGDMYPVTPMGKTLGAIIAVLGIGLVALPAGIIGSGFIEELQVSRKPIRCPHCHQYIDSTEG